MPTLAPVIPLPPQPDRATLIQEVADRIGCTPEELRYLGFTALADALENASPLEAAMTAAGVAAVLEASRP